MKRARRAKPPLAFIKKHQKLTIFGGIILCLFVIGVTSYAYHRHQISNTLTPNKPLDSQKRQPKSPQAATASPTADSPSPTKSAPQPTTTTPPTTAQQNKSQSSPKSTPQSIPYVPPPAPALRFTAGRITNAYTSCTYGVLGYTLGGIDIYSSAATTQSFTWRVELNDGSILEGGTDAMPSGKLYWFNFPSTPSYPSLLGTIQGASDGDRARFVITSPNYSAGGWSDPVPAGSEEACRTGHM